MHCIYTSKLRRNVHRTSNIFLKHLTDSDEHLVIVGDFNLPDVSWSSLTGSTLVSNLFCDFVFESNLTQLINCPTHIKGNTLDILLTNNDSLIRNLSVTESSPLLPFDHHKICFSIQSNSRPRQRKRPTFVFNFTKGDYNGMCDYLLDTDFSDCLLPSSIEQAWSILKYAILTAMHIYIPKVRVKPKHHPKWFNSEIRHAINCLRTLRKKYSLNPTPRNLSKLHSLGSHLHQLMSAAKLLFERNLSMQGSANIFKYLSQLTSSGIIPPVVSLDSTSGSTDFEKVTLFNSSFHSIFTQSSYRIPPSEELPTPTLTLSDIGNGCVSSFIIPGLLQICWA